MGPTGVAAGQQCGVLSATVFNDDGSSSGRRPRQISDHLDAAKPACCGWTPGPHRGGAAQDRGRVLAAPAGHGGPPPSGPAAEDRALRQPHLPRGLRQRRRPRHLSELNIFIAEGWLISVRRSYKGDECVDMLDVAKRFGRTREDNNTVGFLLYTILDAVVDTYFDALDSTEDELEAIESRIFETIGRTEQVLQQDLLDPAARAAPVPAAGRAAARRAPADPAPGGAPLGDEPSATSRTCSTTSCGSPTRSTPSASCSATRSTPTSPSSTTT